MDISQYINQERLRETFIELIKINSPSFEERELGQLLADKLQNAGCRVVFQEYGRSFNIIAFKKGKDTETLPLLLSGHMDTIEPTTGIAFAVEAGTIKSTGNTVLGADDKSALAQIIEAVAVLKERDLSHGDIEIVFTSAEERGLFGAKGLDFSLLKSRHALVLDSSGGVGSLVIAAPSHITYEMRVIGKAAHAGIEPEKGINAIRVAARIISEVPDGRLDHETTANIGIIHGGTATNVVPKEVIINGEIRGHSMKSLEDARQTIFRTARSIVQEYGARLDITDHEEYRTFRIDKETPFFGFLEGVFRRCGIEPVRSITGGGSDANIFNQKEIMTINISNGMQKVHSTEEHISLEDLYKGCLVVLRAVLEFPTAGL